MGSMSWSKQAEQHQVAWRKRHRILGNQYGTQNGVKRPWLLPNDRWLEGTWEEYDFRRLLTQYIEANEIRPNDGKHNLKSSWTQCANVFLPFRFYPHMQRMLCSFLSRELKLEVSSIDALELEYAAPGKLAPRQLLGERGGTRGAGQTSPDVAILFTCKDGKCGIFLVENKYTEHHFYACSAAKKTLDPAHLSQGLVPNPDPQRCTNTRRIIDDAMSNCHQHAWAREYWSLLGPALNKSEWEPMPYCPGMRDGYQLLRQQALAEGIVHSRLFDYVFSGVAYDARNAAIIGCLRDFGIGDFSKGWPLLFKSEVRFHCFTHQSLVSWVCRSRSAYVQSWAQYVCDRYDY
jgi:hypothetical protein